MSWREHYDSHAELAARLDRCVDRAPIVRDAASFLYRNHTVPKLHDAIARTASGLREHARLVACPICDPTQPCAYADNPTLCRSRIADDLRDHAKLVRDRYGAYDDVQALTDAADALDELAEPDPVRAAMNEPADDAGAPQGSTRLERIPADVDRETLLRALAMSDKEFEAFVSRGLRSADDLRAELLWPAERTAFQTDAEARAFIGLDHVALTDNPPDAACGIDTGTFRVVGSSCIAGVAVTEHEAVDLGRSDQPPESRPVRYVDPDEDDGYDWSQHGEHTEKW